MTKPVTNRLRLALMTTGSNGIASLLKMAVLIGITPFLIHFLGTEKYGLVMTILSICIWVNTIADGGIGNSLKNEIIRENAQHKMSDKISTLTSTTFFFA